MPPFEFQSLSPSSPMANQPTASPPIAQRGLQLPQQTPSPAQQTPSAAAAASASPDALSAAAALATPDATSDGEIKCTICKKCKPRAEFMQLKPKALRKNCNECRTKRREQESSTGGLSESHRDRPGGPVEISRRACRSRRRTCTAASGRPGGRFCRRTCGNRCRACTRRHV